MMILTYNPFAKNLNMHGDKDTQSLSKKKTKQPGYNKKKILCTFFEAIDNTAVLNFIFLFVFILPAFLVSKV